MNTKLTKKWFEYHVIPSKLGCNVSANLSKRALYRRWLKYGGEQTHRLILLVDSVCNTSSALSVSS